MRPTGKGTIFFRGWLQTPPRAIQQTRIFRGRQKGISEQTFHRWKRQFGMMPLDQAKRLKELEKENARLKRLLADVIASESEAAKK
jgi:hypothetical protein